MSEERLVKCCLILNDYEAVEYASRLVWLGIRNQDLVSQAVAYLGYPAPGGKVRFGAPTQPVRASIDAKSELGAKERQKLTRPPRWHHGIDVRTIDSWQS